MAFTEERSRWLLSSAYLSRRPVFSRRPAAGANVSIATVDVRTSNGTSFLTDSSGRALYLWTPDTKTTSLCFGACAAAWPPLTVKAAPTAGIGATASDLGTISRSDGTKQVTYAQASAVLLLRRHGCRADQR